MSELAIGLGERYLGNTSHFLASTTGLGKLVSILLSNAITVAGIVLIFLLIYAGSKMQSNQDNPEAVKEGQKVITYSLLGFVIVVAAYFLVRIIESSTGTSILQ